VPFKHPTPPSAAIPAVALLLIARISSAETSALQLTWRAPEGCPSGAEVEAQVGELLGARQMPTSRRLVAVTTVERTDHGTWTVRLETNLEGSTGQRVFEGDSCKTVASTTALILAFALDPDAAGRATQSRTSAPSTEARPSPAPEAALSTPIAKPAEPARLRFHGALQLAALSGILPKPALAARAIVGLGRRTLGAEILGQISDERDKVIDRTSVGGSFRLLSIGARVFWEPFRDPWTLRLAAGGDIEQVTAKGFGVSDPTAGSATMAAGLMALQLGWPLTSHLAFHIEGDVTARADRARFVLSPAGSVFEVPAVSLSGATGVELSF
jgi:hypothetical protein